jgi:chitodextrinase
MRIPRGALLAGLTVFLVLTSAGVASAMWTAPSPLSSTVTAARFSVEVSPADIAKLSVVYSPSALSYTSAISVTNTGDISANYAVQVRAASTPLSDATTLKGWIVTSASQCTPASLVPAQSASAWMSAGLSVPGTLASGAATIFCVRTSIDPTYATTVGAASVPVVTLTYSQGSWSDSFTATATQSVADTLAPSAPGRPVASGTTAAGTTLTWAASNDNVAVTEYEVYRDGQRVNTVTAPNVTFTDAGLTGATTYSYTVKARDAAGNVSAASAAGSVTTRVLDTSVNYRVTSTPAGLCVDGGASPGATGNALSAMDCQDGRSQTWQFVAVGGNYTIVSSASPTLVWEIIGASKAEGAPAITRTRVNGLDSQLWTIASEGNGKAHFTNVNSGKCLTVAGSAKVPPLQQSACKGLASQTFALAQVP